ncbi:MAG: type II toxin-antitoxin system RelE/ParE family toxin [Campylobacterota bacterium]|nr:type II toxin-antitoxin system RelE/ParE family toxin [Campylobacterota bacterium]
MLVKLNDKAIKDLSKIDKLEASKIFSKIENLKDFPKVANLKKLTNFIPPYRLRVGDYRALFDIQDNTITVYRVRHRKDIYN